MSLLQAAIYNHSYSNHSYVIEQSGKVVIVTYYPSHSSNRGVKAVFCIAYI